MTSGKQNNEPADPRDDRSTAATPGRDRDEHDKEPKPHGESGHISDYVTQPPDDAQDS